MNTSAWPGGPTRPPHGEEDTALAGAAPRGSRLRAALLAALGVLALLSACSTAPVAPAAAVPEVPPADARFAAGAPPPTAAEVFALSPAMQHYLVTALAGNAQERRRPAALVRALNTQGDLKLAYDAQTTRTAAQAFEARAGNCLSLVIMTAALAKAQGISVTYNLVQGEPSYRREAGLLLTSSHVNLTLGRPLRDRGSSGFDASAWMTVDFLPGEDLTGQRRQPIDEATVLAMFMNNRAAEAVAQGRLADAHALAREALRHAPGFATARNTLAVVYLRAGLPAEAEALLRSVLAGRPGQTDALANLVAALQAQGRAAEAQAVVAQLAALEPDPPLRAFYAAKLERLTRHSDTPADRPASH